MARIRSIKPEFFTSEPVSSLPLRARLTWIGLWTHCDNYGRARDNVKLIKAAVWPLDDVTLKDIEEDLVVLTGHGRIVRYTVGGRDYLVVTNWSEHQYGANKGEPKFPGPDEAGSSPIPEPVKSRLDKSGSDQDGSSPNQGSGVRGHDSPDRPGAKKSTRPPDDLFDALTAACSINPKELTDTGRGAINGALAQLRRVGATPADIPRRAATYQRKFPNAPLTPTALAKQWAACAQSTQRNPSFWTSDV